jgi:hypothetical protein
LYRALYTSYSTEEYAKHVRIKKIVYQLNNAVGIELRSTKASADVTIAKVMALSNLFSIT